MNPKPGFLTSEFWLSAVHKVLSFAITAGFLTSQAAAQWETALAGAVAVIFVVLASWGVTVTYTNGRTELKSLEPPSTAPLVVLLAFFFLAPAAWAGGLPCADSPRARCSCPPQCRCGCQAGEECNCVRQTALLPWRNRRNQEHQALKDRVAALENQLRQQAPVPSPAPSQPQVIVVPQQPAPNLTPPLQTIPLGGLPLQTIPLGGVPHQVIPLGGVPHVLIPLGDVPRQQIPLGGPPKQPIDDGGKPKGQIPLGNQPDQGIMPRVDGEPSGTGPTHNQQYSRAYALYRK
jgi:hypothetical protein